MFLRSMRLFGVEVAPLLIPLKRRLETFAVVHFVTLWILLPIFSLWVPFYIFFCTRIWWTMIIYAIWTFYERNRQRMGSRPLSWYRESWIWREFADYFPLTLVKTAELPPDRNYIIGSHPHGVLSIGAFTHMLTTATGFTQKFPGLKSTILTLNGQFYFPFRRDVGIALGGVESSRQSLEYLLENPGKGRAITIVLGGAVETLDAHPGNFDLNLMKRRGYCKYALKYGADLVPMYNFGENDLYDQVDNPRGSKLREMQMLVYKAIGFPMLLFSGRGVFNYNFGILPHRRPVTSVVGKPIRVEKREHPTADEVDALHTKYCEALFALFEKHKKDYGIEEDVHLNMY